MSIEFPLLKKNTPFGPLSDPKILVAVKTLSGYRAYRFLIDTGADFSVAPRLLAQQIGLDWDRLPTAGLMGVEQGGMQARLGPLPIRIDRVELTVRCLFLDLRNPLFILGRAEFLERFVLTIDDSRQKIILTEIP